MRLFEKAKKNIPQCNKKKFKQIFNFISFTFKTLKLQKIK